MSDDQNSALSSQSWLGRIGGAIKGLSIRLMLFVVASPLSFWNKGRALERYQTNTQTG
ncbi:hypothetical protein NBRC116492_34520 [Aurantivibrio infirmus]